MFRILVSLISSQSNHISALKDVHVPLASIRLTDDTLISCFITRITLFRTCLLDLYRDRANRYLTIHLKQNRYHQCLYTFV